MKIPHRKSLVLQTVDILRGDIVGGEWRDRLPGERDLCRRLHISRPTLRAALEMLEREKLIESAHGKARRILRPNRRRSRRRSGSVVLIAPVPLYSMSRNRIFLLDHLGRVLAENRFRFDVVAHRAFGGKLPAAALNKLRHEHKADVYLLALTSREVQEWFGEQGLPAVIIGSSFPGTKLPTIENDYPATGRHAAGLLLGRGHRRVMVVAPDSDLAGDLETLQAFRNEVVSSVHPHTECHVVRYGADPQLILAQWETLRSGNQPPTAAFTLYPQAATALLTHLLAQGVRIPAEFSILCRDSAPLFDWMTPQIAHYQLPLEHFARKLSALVLECFDSATSLELHTTVIPDLEMRDSLGVAPGGKRG